jgi:type VI secretion system protein ImpL
MKIFRDVRFWMALGVICLLVVTWLGSGLVRVGDPPVAMGWQSRLLLVILVGVFVGLVYLIAWLASRQTNARVLKDITEDEGTVDGSLLSEEEQQLRAKFKEATARISSLRLGGGRGRRNFYQLPWYVVIGSPGSGKTTAIRHSGLEFPLDDITGGGSLGGVGGTRNCDWWVTDRAVLLDTAGRYTTQDSSAVRDAKGWKNFLAMLRKHRKRQPLNGAVLVVSTEELLRMNDDEWKNHARTLTRRLQELTSEFKMRFPVYLLVTKVDLLAGCREYFDYLDTEEQEQIWGTTLPLDGGLAGLSDELSSLAKRLHQQLPSKLRYERDVRRRRAIYSFPWQLEAVFTRIEQLATSVFRHDALAGQAQLRGVYLSSAVQEGTPIERLVGGVAGGFGISGSQISTNTVQSRSLFLRRLFPDLIFRESFLAGTNTGYEKTMRRLRVAAFSLIMLVGVGISVVWSSAFGIHRTLLGQSKEQLALFEATPHGPDRTLAENLFALQYMDAAHAVFAQQQHPWLSNLGMYEDSIEEASREAYARAVGALIAPRIASETLAWLNTTAEVEFQPRFDALKAYLMLSRPGRRDEQWLSGWLMNDNPLEALRGDSGAIAVRHLAALFEESPDFAVPESADAVERQRERLVRYPQEQQLYARLKRDSGSQMVDLSGDLGPYFATVFQVEQPDALTVPRLYTRAGYSDISFGPQAGWVLNWIADRWVLDEDTSPPPPLELLRIINSMKRLYAQDYVTTWQSVLRAVDISVAGDGRLPTLLRHLSEPALSPMSMLLNLVSSETDLPSGDDADNASSAAVALAERQSGRMMSLISNIRMALPEVEVYDLPANVSGAFAEYRYMVQGDLVSKDARVKQEIGELRQWVVRKAAAGKADDDAPVEQLLMTAEELAPPFSDWVASLAESARESAGANRMQRINELWSREVTEACLRAFRGRFPFFPESERDVATEDFETFFGPGGIEDSFVSENLDPLLREDSKLLSNSTRWTMRHGDRIREAFFNRSGSLGFRYELTAVDVDDRIGQLVIESGERNSARFRHGPPVPLALEWPDGNRGITLTYELKSGGRLRRVIEGPWAIFRLAQGSGRGDAGSQIISLGEGEYRALFSISTDSPVNPFDPGLLDKYSCRDRP